MDKLLIGGFSTNILRNKILCTHTHTHTHRASYVHKTKQKCIIENMQLNLLFYSTKQFTVIIPSKCAKIFKNFIMLLLSACNVCKHFFFETSYRLSAWRSGRGCVQQCRCTRHMRQHVWRESSVCHVASSCRFCGGSHKKKPSAGIGAFLDKSYRKSSYYQRNFNAPLNMSPWTAMFQSDIMYIYRNIYSLINYNN